MQGHRLVVPFHVPGTLTANITVTWKVAFDCVLKHVSGVASNDSDATLMFGISTDTNSILTAAVIGDSDVPVEKVQSDFDAVNPTGVLSKGDIAVLTIDYDGSAGTAAADLTVILTFLEG